MCGCCCCAPALCSRRCITRWSQGGNSSQHGKYSLHGESCRRPVHHSGYIRGDIQAAAHLAGITSGLVMIGCVMFTTLVFHAVGHICCLQETVLCSAPCLDMLPVYACFADCLAAEASLLFCLACMLNRGIAGALHVKFRHLSTYSASRLSCLYAASARAQLESQWPQGL